MPRYQHDCEVSLVEAVGKCHFLGRGIDGDGQRLDLYLHVRDGSLGGGRSELVARYGNEGEDYLAAAVADLADVRWRPNGYGLTLAWQAAEAKGYDMDEVALGTAAETSSQAYEDYLGEGGDIYAGTGMADEGADTLDT